MSGFKVEDAARANTVLRRALGLDDEQFSTEQFVGMISDEIDQLRAAGKSDADIADVLKRDAAIELHASDIERYYAPPEARRRG